MTFLHVFPYSPRPGTPAARMPQVNGGLRKERAKRLRELGTAQVDKHMQTLIGRTLPVLVEKGNKGRTPYFSEAMLDRDVAAGSLVEFQVTGTENGFLKGEIV